MIEGDALGMTVEALLDVLPGPDGVLALAGELRGGDQHFGLVGTKLQGQCDVVAVGCGAELTMVAPFPDIGQRALRVGLEHFLDRAVGGFRVLHILPQESSEPVKRDDPRGIEGNRFAVVPLGLIELRLRLIALAQQVFQLGGLSRLIRVRLDCIVQVDQMPSGVVRTLELDGKRGAPPLELAIVRVLPQ